MGGDRWDPDQYGRFRAEREAPFLDLAALIRPRPGVRAVDLGCGTGELTVRVRGLTPGCRVTGVDASPAMLARAATLSGDGVDFRLARIEDVVDEPGPPWDLVFSHAALHWIPGHEDFFPRLLARVAPGGQVAIQMPDNFAAPSHEALRSLVAEPAWAARLGGAEARREVLSIERYAELLVQAGFAEQACSARIYAHVLESTSAIVEWVKGTALTPFLSLLDDVGKAAFVADYRERLLATTGDRRPCFFPFRRVLIWAERAR